MFHGLGDACIYPGMSSFDKLISEGTGAYSKCIEVGLPTVGEYFNNFEYIAQLSCSKIAADANFDGEFNVIGLSQGGLLARYIVEECEMKGTVRNIVTLGGPHMGVDGVPKISNIPLIGPIVDFVAKKLVYIAPVQNWLAPAGYFRDVNNMAKYEAKSVFLPALNNENQALKTSKLAALKKENFGSLNAAMFVMFSEDTIIVPKESAWFQQYDLDGKI